MISEEEISDIPNYLLNSSHKAASRNLNRYHDAALTTWTNNRQNNSDKMTDKMESVFKKNPDVNRTFSRYRNWIIRKYFVSPRGEVLEFPKSAQFCYWGFLGLFDK